MSQAALFTRLESLGTNLLIGLRAFHAIRLGRWIAWDAMVRANHFEVLENRLAMTKRYGLGLKCGFFERFVLVRVFAVLTHGLLMLECCLGNNASQLMIKVQSKQSFKTIPSFRPPLLLRPSDSFPIQQFPIVSLLTQQWL